MYVVCRSQVEMATRSVGVRSVTELKGSTPSGRPSRETKTDYRGGRRMEEGTLRLQPTKPE